MICTSQFKHKKIPKEIRIGFIEPLSAFVLSLKCPVIDLLRSMSMSTMDTAAEEVVVL